MAERVSFDRSLYLPEAIDAAISAFREHAQIEVTPTDAAVLAVISAVDVEESAVVVNSFCNYALQETITRKRQTTA